MIYPIPKHPERLLTLTFSDDFPGSSVDTSKWTTPLYTGRTNAANSELEWYLDANVTVANSALSLTALQEVGVHNAITYNYSSGAIDTSGKFSQTYGYFEARVKVPSGQGLWPGFWLLQQSHVWPPELDVMEILGHQPAKAYFTVHYDSGGHQQTSGNYTGADYSVDWHIFGMDWQPGYVKFYVDGILRFTVSANIPTNPMYLILNLAVGGTFPGSPDGTTVFPAVYQVDWVKAYLGNEPANAFQAAWDRFWLQPIPATATFSTFQISPDSTTGFHCGNTIQVDASYQVTTTNSDPTRNVYQPGAWDDRDSGLIQLTTFHVPASFTLPDASVGNTPNNPTIILNTDTGQCLYLNGCARPSSTGNIWGYIANKNSTHGGSYTAGGEITLAELGSTINHALAILVNASKYLSANGSGYVSPAYTADSGYAGIYGGSNVNLKMGTRVGIPANVAAASLGVTSQYGLALYAALRTYGAYIIDNSAWDAFYICATTDASSAITTIDTEIQALFGAMEIIT